MRVEIELPVVRFEGHVLVLPDTAEEEVIIEDV
jgi:hypothetical protein